jgi:hypothetical protein
MTPEDESNARHASPRPVFSRVTPGSPVPSLAAAQARTAERHTHSVLVAASLPGTVRVAEVDRQVECERDVFVAGQLDALILNRPGSARG